MTKIKSRHNPICMHLKKLGINNAYRKQNGEFLCDGIKLLEEAVKCKAEIPIVLTSSNVPFPLSIDSKLYYTDQTLIDFLSPLKNAQDILFTCRIPDISLKPEMTGTHILLDNVQDPGNVGTIIRTADAFGIKTVMLTGECADPYNPKTIRGTMGSVFRQSVYNVSNDDLIDFKNTGLRIVGTALLNDCRDFTKISYENTIIAIGNEGSGLSDAILSICDALVTIPIRKDSQSLNAAVAAAIIMYEARCLL